MFRSRHGSAPRSLHPQEFPPNPACAAWPANEDLFSLALYFYTARDEEGRPGFPRASSGVRWRFPAFPLAEDGLHWGAPMRIQWPNRVPLAGVHCSGQFPCVPASLLEYPWGVRHLQDQFRMRTIDRIEDETN